MPSHALAIMKNNVDAAEGDSVFINGKEYPIHHFLEIGEAFPARPFLHYTPVLINTAGQFHPSLVPHAKFFPKS